MSHRPMSGEIFWEAFFLHHPREKERHPGNRYGFRYLQGQTGEHLWGITISLLWPGFIITKQCYRVFSQTYFPKRHLQPNVQLQCYVNNIYPLWETRTNLEMAEFYTTRVDISLGARLNPRNTPWIYLLGQQGICPSLEQKLIYENSILTYQICMLSACFIQVLNINQMNDITIT